MEENGFIHTQKSHFLFFRKREITCSHSYFFACSPWKRDLKKTTTKNNCRNYLFSCLAFTQSGRRTLAILMEHLAAISQHYKLHLYNHNNRKKKSFNCSVSLFSFQTRLKSGAQKISLFLQVKLDSYQCFPLSSCSICQHHSLQRMKHRCDNDACKPHSYLQFVPVKITNIEYSL